jgi:hypothetical protein
MPGIADILPIMGTLGLVSDCLDASLDLTLSREKSRMIISSLSSSILPFFCVCWIIHFDIGLFSHYDIRTSIINIIPLALSAAPLPSRRHSAYMKKTESIVIYESSCPTFSAFWLLIMLFSVADL